MYILAKTNMKTRHTAFLVTNGVLPRCAFGNYQNLVEAMPQFMSGSQAEELTTAGWVGLQFYYAASCEAVRQNLFSWLMVPKAHTLAHMLDDQLSERYNSRFYHNYEGESLVGALKPLAFRCLGPGMEARVLRRTILKLVTLKESDIARIGRRGR